MTEIEDVRTFKTGLSTIFLGIFQMLEAIDPGFAEKVLDDFTKAEVPMSSSGTSETSEMLPISEAPAEITEDQKKSDTEEKSTSEKPVSTITQDDITKIIVQKIKKDRSNNERIGRILRNLGAAKVSELPAEKYESFVTELSAL